MFIHVVHVQRNKRIPFSFVFVKFKLSSKRSSRRNESRAMKLARVRLPLSHVGHAKRKSKRESDPTTPTISDRPRLCFQLLLSMYVQAFFSLSGYLQQNVGSSFFVYYFKIAAIAWNI